MQKLRARVLTIGGFDPSGGAGILADIKVFEQHKLLGSAVNTANTIQNSKSFMQVNWLKEEDIISQIEILLAETEFKYVKIGIVPSFEFLSRILETYFKDSFVIWDPVLSASAGYEFHSDTIGFSNVLKHVDLLTPNWEECMNISKLDDAMQGATMLSETCSVYLKGGHNPTFLGKDFLFTKNKQIAFNPKKGNYTPKHGSGCIFSAALLSNMALGYPIQKACLRSKDYISRILSSNPSLLSYHKF